MVKILKATFGDEFGNTNVMKSLSDKVKDGEIDVYVDSSIIPIVDRATGVGSTRLTPQEEEEITSAAEDICGPSDQVCLEVKKDELLEAAIKKKAATKTASTAEIIKGRRLKVTYQTESGETRTAVIPEGQQFRVGKLGETSKDMPVETKIPAWKQLLDSGWTIAGLFVATFFWAASIILTWMTFVRYDSKILAAGMTAIAVLIPYSGFGLSFFGPFIAEYFRVDKMARLKAAVPEEVASVAKAAPGLIPNAPALPTMDKGLIPAAPPVLGAPMKGGRILSRRK
jgi:hypothetical protein